MARKRTPYDEIMIVNPIAEKGARHMKFYPMDHRRLSAYVAEDPYDEMGYVADPPPGFTEGYPAGIGYVAEEPYEEVAYVAEEPFGEVGYVAEDPYGEVGYVAEDPDEEVAYVAEDPYGEVGFVAEGPYGEVGYVADEGTGYTGEDEDEIAYAGEDEEFAAADELDDVGAYGEDPDSVDAYVREDREPEFSPRVVPTTRLEGYVRPKSINPTAEKIRPAETVSRPSSEWFKPLW